MKKKVNESVLWYIAAICYFVIVLIDLVSEGKFDVLNFCLGSAMLCFGSSAAVRNKKNTDKSDKDNNDNT